MKYLPHIFIVAVVIIAGVFLWRRFGPVPAPVLPPASGVVPVTQGQHVTHGSPSLPQPDEHTTGVLHVTVPPDTVAGMATGKPRDIFIYLTDDPAKPPTVRSETPIQAAFSPVVDPWIMLQAKFMLGGSLSNDGDVSPWGGVGAIRLFRHFDIGGGVDEDGIGVFVSYQAWREFDVGAMYYLLPLFESDARACLFVAYRF